MIEIPYVGQDVWVIRTGMDRHEPKIVRVSAVSYSIRLGNDDTTGVQCENYSFWYSRSELYLSKREAMLAILEDKKLTIECIHENYKNELDNAYEDWSDYLQLFKSKYGEI